MSSIKGWRLLPTPTPCATLRQGFDFVAGCAERLQIIRRIGAALRQIDDVIGNQIRIGADAPAMATSV